MISKVARIVGEPRFVVRDCGATRRDLASRKEIKFSYRHADVGKLRHLLAANCRRLIHNKPLSMVRSIYFDDARFSACRANLDGIGRRRKLRLRWYDSLLPQQEFYFEIKWRQNRVTGKHRFQLESSTPIHALTYKQITRGLEQVLPRNHRGELWEYSEPVVIVEYKREHFASDDGSLRITLDYDITYYDQLGRSAPSALFPRRMDSLVVLEGKTPIGRESELRSLLFPFSARMSRCSKYVNGCQLLGHV
jgi:hypothetical protein